MNREFKFRFWNRIAQRFQPASKYAIDGKGDLVAYDYEMGAYNDAVSFSKTCIVAQQYTGLKDKNDKEIYEGDIVKIFNHPLYEEVVYEPEGSGFGLFMHDNENKDNAAFEFLSDWTGSGGYEVIGNIFENNELLK